MTCNGASALVGPCRAPAGARRRSPGALAAAGVVLLLALCAPALAFDLDDVAKRARSLADDDYRPPDRRLPDALRNLNYDQYRDIRYRPDANRWRADKLPFELAFFHPGSHYDEPVRISEIGVKGVRRIPFDPAAFDYGDNAIDPTAIEDAGFVGFRVHHALNRPSAMDEVLTFLGASYFRGVGEGQRYGASARGLAIDTGQSSGEEFPRFVEFWVERPKPLAKTLTVYALLDSRRATGAYRFVITPGAQTVMDVSARLYLRENVNTLGIAPLTSMFFFGENQRAPYLDFRPEVHDSDGLSIRADDGEWIWRPLIDPRKLLATSFALENPRGFGLMQRDRAFGNYDDLEARYDLRPSVWVEPRGDWGKGRVELVLIPSPDETNDNVVAYWVPATQPEPGTPMAFDYRILWQRDPETRPPTAWVTQSRRGYGYGEPHDGVAFNLDFEGPALRGLADDVVPTAHVWASDSGRLLDTNLYRNDVTGGWRLRLRVHRSDRSRPVEVRALLRVGDRQLSETWSHVLPAQ